ncbi:MAG: iron ABC transporter permease [Planctomycetota bacterium]
MNQPLTARRFFFWLGGCIVLLLLLLAAAPGIGTEIGAYTWWDAWRARLGSTLEASELSARGVGDFDRDGSVSDEEAQAHAATAKYVGFELRFPRSLLALQVGITLALCGASLQVLFRNPLADPYTLGIASGGALGALLAIRCGCVTSILGVSTVALSSFLGALGVVGSVFVFAKGSRRLTSNELLLAGVAIGLFCGAMMMLVTAVSNERVTFEAVRWMMGSLDPIARAPGAKMLPLLLPAWVLLIFYSRSFNQYRLGDDLAEARGVSVSSLQTIGVIVTTLATAAVVAECGPIGFVGLVVPQAVALLVGSDCRILFPASALMGGAFLILCDWTSQFSMRLAGWATGRHLGSATLPIGVVTAIVGVPIFLFLLRRRSR